MTLVVVLLSLVGFVALVGLLAANNAHRTDGRACCAPADLRQDLRMRGVGDEPPAEGSSPELQETVDQPRGRHVRDDGR
jgi:hypothetical protein